MMARSISHFLFVKRMKILGGNQALLSGSPFKLKLLLRNFEMIFTESFLKKSIMQRTTNRFLLESVPDQ